MTDVLDRILQKYGQTVEVGQKVICAFFQPSSESGKTAPFLVTALGAEDDRKWVYLGRTQVSLGETVVYQGHTFTVKNCVPVPLRSETVFWWAMLTREREAVV